MNTKERQDNTLLNLLLEKAKESNQPVSGSFEITNRCNLDCGMCYINVHANDKEEKRNELTAVEWLRIAQDASDAGMVFLLITGGEIFLRRDFFEIYEPLKKMGLVITLFSNGTLITKSLAKRLSENPPNKIEITLYGASSETYEKVIGSGKGYELTRKGIENLLEVGIKPVLKTTLTNDNTDELPVLKQYAEDLGLPLLPNWLLTPRVDDKPSIVNELRLPTNDIFKLEKEHAYSTDKWQKVSLVKESVYGNDIFYCSAGKSSFTINARGEMNACIDLPLPAAKTPVLGFNKAWKEVKDFIEEANKMKSTCSTCEAKNFCSTCPARSYLETRTFDEPVHFLCEVTKKRKEFYSLKSCDV